MHRKQKAEGKRQKAKGRGHASRRVEGARISLGKIQNPKSKIQNRAGTTYLAVCGMVLLVATISLGALAATRVRTRTSRNANNIADARQYALSATEVGRLWIAQDKNWRSDYSNGTWFANKAIGQGTFSLSVTNPNGALNRSMFDPVILSATGTCGKAVQSASVTLNAQTVPYTCMNAALSAATGITLSGNVIIEAENQTLATNGAVSAPSSVMVNANVAAMGAISGSTYNGANSTLSTALTFPDATAFNFYQQNGTAIAFSSLSGNNLQKVLLSPTSNPFGGQTNANGIYVIDCQGNNLTIQNCRFVGTLVLLNPGSLSIQSSVVWCPAVSNYPCLMVNGSLTINLGNGYLNESGSQNYNPPGTPYPYPSGTANSTTSDSFPSSIQGLIYVAGSLTVQGNQLAANSIVVGGAFSTNSSVSLYLSNDGSYYKSPPPGFGTIQMVVSPEVGSRRRTDFEIAAASRNLAVNADVANQNIIGLRWRFHGNSARTIAGTRRSIVVVPLYGWA